MKNKDLKKLTTEKLIEKLQLEKEELSKLCFDVKIGQETDFNKIAKKRKLIARIMTIINNVDEQNTVEEITEVVETKVVKEKATKTKETK